MLFTIIVLLFSIAVISLLISKRNNKKTSKHQYSNLANRSKRKKSSSSTPINQAYVNDNAAPTVAEPIKINKEVVVPEDFLDFELLISEKLDNEQKKVITEIGQSFRKPHPLLLPLTQRTFEPNELFDLIKTDAEMTAKVLNAVNSPLFALHQPITNINHAIIFMGISQVKSIALQFAMQQGMTFKDKNQNEAYNKLWKASYLASSFCLLFAKEMGETNPAELATRCLLSYLGDLAILSYKPELASFYLDDFTLFERTKIFQELLGTNAAVVGHYLAQEWQLPASLESGIAHSILPLTNATVNANLPHENLRQVLLCYLACRLGDLVAFNGVNDISKVDKVSFEALGEIEFYYTQESIENAGFNKINAVIADPAFRKKLNKLISKVA